MSCDDFRHALPAVALSGEARTQEYVCDASRNARWQLTVDDGACPLLVTPAQPRTPPFDSTLVRRDAQGQASVQCGDQAPVSIPWCAPDEAAGLAWDAGLQVVVTCTKLAQPRGSWGGLCLEDKGCSPDFTGLGCGDDFSCACARPFFPCGAGRVCAPP